MSNCTLTENWSYSRGGGIYARAGTAHLFNTIIWANDPYEVYESGGSVVATCSDIKSGWPGSGNLSADPLFCGPAAGDFTLDAASPCLDAPGCDLVGGFGQGCDGFRTHVAEGQIQTSSWGAIKALYR